ncbi:HAD-like domain-containing protein [Xylogone sp. PMI_703]|nr:HAD-like domain-containing protein [Xylogone sp. PMI_703]
MPKITTLLFDCDNTLVLSEELAFEACAELGNEILASHGVSDRYTGPQLLSEFVGQNFRGMMVSLQKKYNYQMDPVELERYVSREEDQVIAKLRAALRPCEGVDPVLEKLDAEKKYKLAVVSSSALRRVIASIEKVNQDRFFKKEEVFSAASSLPVPTSKPDPAVYLHAMKVLGVQPGECVAIEDSRSGATAAVRAGIITVGYVGSYETAEKQEEMIGVLKGVGCVEIMRHWDEFEGLLKKIEES